MEYYAFTVKFNCPVDFFGEGRPPTEIDYLEWLHNAQMKGFNTLKYCYEFDSRGHMHIHGIATWKKAGLKRLLMFRDFHQKVDALKTPTDIVQWMIYIHKDYISPDIELLKRNNEANIDKELQEMEEIDWHDEHC